MSYVKKVPEGAAQHVTAGPYSPALAVEGKQLVLLSGQAPLDMAGAVMGDTIEEQTECVLNNCERLLEKAGCTLANVVKCTVYMKDLTSWDRFNAVYARRMPDPKPTRTAVGVQLLPGFLVEIDMWAVV